MQAAVTNSNDKTKASPTPIKKPEAKVTKAKPAATDSKDSAKRPAVAPLKGSSAAKGVTPAKTPVVAPKTVTTSSECKHNEKKDDSKKENAPEQSRSESLKSQFREEVNPKPEVVKINSKINGTRIVLARVYTKLKDIENAKKIYNQILDLEPNVRIFKDLDYFFKFFVDLEP